MKNVITKTAQLTVIFLIAVILPLNAITQYDPDKDEVKVVTVKEPVVNSIARALEIPDSDIAILASQLEDIKIVTITAAIKELDLHLNPATLAALGLEEDLTSSTMENWMFADNYYTEDFESSKIESWMMEELVPAEPEMQFESWMFGELTKK